jgi:Protein of unknown function (DUF420)/Transposase zinc-binding domain
MTPDERINDRVALWMIGLVSSGVVLAVGFPLVGRHGPMGAAHTISALPLVNAWLNGTSALLLAAGYWFIGRRKVTAHKTCMVTTFGVSSCFLASYVIYTITRARSPSWATGGFGVGVASSTTVSCTCAVSDAVIPASLGFRCKGRGFCPSCGGRRMSGLAAHLVDRVLPHVPIRQWVFTVPVPIRYRLAFDAALTRAVLRVFLRTVFGWQRRRAARRGLVGARSGGQGVGDGVRGSRGRWPPTRGVQRDRTSILSLA